MDRTTKRVLVALLLLVPALVIAGVAVYLPKAPTPRDEALPAGDLTRLAVANVTDGGPDRAARGTAALYWNGTGHLLRFEDYGAESGPNVWFFAVRSAAADSEAAVEDDGLLLRVPGPGHATYRGTFHVPLPAAYDPDERPVVVAWDRTLDERFAVVAFTTVAPVPSPGTDDGGAAGTAAPGAPAQHP